MAAAYRFNPTRSTGWFRLGIAAATGVIFVTPMLWALGMFGPSEDAIHRAVIFAFSGIWFCIGVGYLVGWSMSGFLVRIKEGGEGEEGGRRADGPHRPPSPPPANRPPASPPPPR